MARTIITRDDIALLRPLWGKGASLRLWAEEGLVCWEDSSERALFGSMTWQEAALRVIALSDMVAKPVDGGYASERQQIQRFICEMENVIRKAKEQGGPEFAAELTEDYKRNRPKTFLVPQVVELD